MLPKIVIADLSCDNSKDVLLAVRIQKSVRTNEISLLLIIPRVPDPFVKKNIIELQEQITDEKQGRVETIGYPFAFGDLLEKIKAMVAGGEVGSGSDEPAVVDLNKSVATHLFDSTVTVETKLHEISVVLRKNWGFPFTVVKALDILESNSGCCTELAKCIATDPAVSSTVLKIANTVLYARRSGRINDIRDAVVRMGFKETRNIMACLSLIDLSPKVYRNRGFGRREFWLHSLSVGLIAQKLCVDSGFRRPELAFMAGLLHDLGKIPLDNSFDTVFPKLLDKSMASFCAFYEAEDQLMNFTHAQLGHYLTTQWNFPSPISMAILNHHDVDRILTASPLFDKIIQEAVFIANQLTKAASLGHSCDEILEEIPIEMLRDLKLTTGPGERFFTVILRQLAQLCSYLHLNLHKRHLFLDDTEEQQSDIILVYNDKLIYHPMVVALRDNGFKVRQSTHFIPENMAGKQVVISIPERGLPLDIMLYGDEPQTSNVKVLKIFLVDMEQSQERRQNVADTQLLFMDRKTFDTRLLLHTLDTFFERIILPARPQEDDQPA